MIYSITKFDGEYQVWVQLEEGRPERQGNSFIIGVGPTKLDAIAAAIKDLHETLEAIRQAQETLST